METYSIQELKGILTEKQNEIVASFKEIIIEGDLKLSRQPWKKGNRFGIFFDLVDQQESFQCNLWTSSSSEFERINTLQYKKVKCQGEITLNKIYGNFQFRVHSIELCIDKESYLEELKKECLLRNYFIEKKKINWFSIQNILLFSKKNTQGYSDFMQQLFIPFHITEIEIPLEGPSTSSSIIEHFENLNLERFDLILIIRGGGNTTEISNSFDKLELFTSIKSSPIPVITAIGHANDTKDKLLITDISDFDVETPTSLAKYINNIFLNTFQYRITEELEKNQDLIHSIEIKQYREIESVIHKEVKKWIKEKSPYFIIDCPMEKEIIFHRDGKFFKQTIDLSNEIQIKKEELDFFKRLEEEIEKNHIENIFIMLKPYSIDSILSSYKKWKEVKKEIFLIPWEEKIEKCPYRLRGMLLSLHKELTSKNTLEKDLFFSLKKFFSL